MTQAIVDAQGHYLGGIPDGAPLPASAPAGAALVPTAPDNAGAIWNGKTWVAPAETPDQLFGDRIAAGIQIVSTATPALNGTYPIDPATQPLITGVVTSINAGKGLPGNQPTLPWADIGGNPHSFAATDFVNFAKVVEDYIFACSQTRALLKAGQTATWPALPVTIP